MSNIIQIKGCLKLNFLNVLFLNCLIYLYHIVFCFSSHLLTCISQDCINMAPEKEMLQNFKEVNFQDISCQQNSHLIGFCTVHIYVIIISVKVCGLFQLKCSCEWFLFFILFTSSCVLAGDLVDCDLTDQFNLATLFVDPRPSQKFEHLNFFSIFGVEVCQSNGLYCCS